MAAFTIRDPLLPEIFALHGKWRPHREAAVFGGERLTWGQLAKRTDQVAFAMAASGLQIGDRAAILMGNGAPMLETLLGGMRAGVATAAINLSVTDPAAAAMIRDCGAKAIFCTPDQAVRIDASAELAEATAGLLRIACGGPRAGWFHYAHWRDCHPSAPLRRIPPAAPLNIIYSSGTTGLPKGIVHTQQGRRDWASDLAVALRYHGAARTLITIGLYSNISWVSLLCTLMAGGCVVVEDKFDAHEFWRIVARERITHASMVPVQYQRILETDPGEGADIASIDAMMSCGSPLWPDLKKALFHRFGPRVIELYGLTEGVITTLDPEDAEGRLASVGRPLIGTDIRIVDDAGAECPAGVPGEIVATGRIVMPGYHNRPEATEEATWTAPDGQRWLRTGDIGRLDQEGFLYIVDRKKDMILSGGQNIYPQDIEAVLVQHPALREAAVIPARSERWGETPLALVVPKDDAALDLAELREWANSRLGKQQRVADVLAIGELPRNPNGKILKRQLRDQFADRSYA
jgi:acyl-CoA synthetase (AMP-forming)/AMP-acid ligase II